jgi:hypothetical protein
MLCLCALVLRGTVPLAGRVLQEAQLHCDRSGLPVCT